MMKCFVGAANDMCADRSMHMSDARTGCRGRAHGFRAFGCAPRDGLPAVRAEKNPDRIA